MALCRSRIPVRETPVGRPPEIPRIHLSVRKPKNWRISLTTSSSSASIAVPDITLSDERGRILIDTSAPDTPKRNARPRRRGSGTATNIPTIAANRPGDRGPATGTGRRETDPRGPGRGRPGGGGRGRSSAAEAATRGGACSGGDTGDSFAEEKEGQNFARGASEIVRVKVSDACKTKNEFCAGIRRSKRRLVSSKQSAMGSNVSRQSGKGLSGRRTQSSGNLCNGARLLGPSVNKLLSSCGGRRVSNRDRNKFCGSLPSHLDEKDIRSGECSPDSLYSFDNNNGDVYFRASDGKNMGPVSKKGQPRHRKDFSAGDQGYASERSPEEEHPPKPLEQEPLSSRPYANICLGQYSFMKQDNIFDVRVEKNSRGLGLSVTGGVDTAEKFPGLIRIKRLFPNQPAWESQMLQVGDVLLAANGVSLYGLTNNEALEVLRTTPNEVVLSVCRPPEGMLSVPLPSSCEPPPPPRRDPARVITSCQVNAPGLMQQHSQVAAEPNEFEIVLNKVNGSLGFVLRKEDGSVLGHCVRALVREPALSDGRIRPGDKIVTVNGVDISPLSHEEAVMYLRQCGEEVRLRLYRDPAQTPLSALSPTESCKTVRLKPALRKEAMDMLSDLAVKKMSPHESSGSSGRTGLRGTSPSSSPRMRKPKKTPSDEKPERPSNLKHRKNVKRVSFLEMEREEDTDSIITVTSGSDILRMSMGSAARTCPSSGGRRTGVCLEHSSMPPMSASSSGFSYSNPVYQSAHPAIQSETEPIEEESSEEEMPKGFYGDGGGPGGLLKWKGVLFVPDDDECNGFSNWSEYEVLTVELCRSWNSRLGFSLQSSGSGTIVRAVHADSVAARDGRLRAGDEVVMINYETTAGMTTAEVIDLLRRVRGTIAITVRRKRKTES